VKGDGVTQHQLPPLLKPDQLDQLGLALITLAQEMWVIKDRQIVLEAILEEQGLAHKVAAYQPDAALSAKLTRERERFIGQFTNALIKTG